MKLDFETLVRDAFDEWKSTRELDPSPADILPEGLCPVCNTEYHRPDTCSSCSSAWDAAAEWLAFRAGFAAGMSAVSKLVEQSPDTNFSISRPEE